MSPGGQGEEGTQTAVLWAAWEQALVQQAVAGSPATRQIQLCHLGLDAPRAVPCYSSHRVVRAGGR